MFVLAAQINPTIGDLEGNTHKIVSALRRAREKKADVVLFPEMSLCGYFPEDLLLDADFIDAISKKLDQIAPETKGLFIAVGLPRWNPKKKEKPLYNSVAVFADGKLLGYKNKSLLPTYDVFDERRYFEPDEAQPIWEHRGKKIAITICEEVWQHSQKIDGYTDYAFDPIVALKDKKLDLVLNLSASPYYYKRSDIRLSVFQKVAKTLHCPVVLCNQVGGNDSLIFDGHSLCVDAKGELVQMAKGFVEDDLWIDLNQQLKPIQLPKKHIGDLYSALVLGLKDYMHKQGFKRALLGLSGGIDSALVACIAKDALGAKNVTAISLPSRYSSKASLDDAKQLSSILEIEWLDFSIEPVFQEYLRTLEPKFKDRPFDVTEENLQTRIRGAILMAYSNKFGAILLNTGNKSEMAMGYCTLYGDMAGGFSVLQDVVKMHVYDLARYVQVIPHSIIDKVPSAELKENQTDYDTLPRYEILDPIIEDYIEERLSIEEIAKKRKTPLDFVKKIVHQIHCAEYKRRQAALGLRVTQKAFGKGRCVPVVQKWR